MKRIAMSRENVYQLFGAIRDTIEKEVDISEYLEVSTGSKTDLEVDFTGISNGFLSEVVSMLSGYQVEVFGQVEELFPCPCCGFRTLTEHFNPEEGTGYDICPYCNWEDDGTSEIDSGLYRSINRGSIEDYRNNISTNSNRYYIKKWLE